MDRFVNNRAPKRLVLILALLLCISASAAYLISGKCAEKIVKEQIRSELSVAGGGKLTVSPDEEHISAGEVLLDEYGIDRSLSPQLMHNYKSVRKTIFIPVFGLAAAVSLFWFIAALMELMAIYRDLEAIRKECIAAADSPDKRIGLYGHDLSSVRRIAEAADLLVSRLDHTLFSLSSEQKYLRSFLTDLSHQIKTSLAVVRLNTDMLSELPDISEEQRTKLSDEIQLNLDAMENMVIEAIKMAKLDADAVEYDMQEQSPAEVCSLALKRLAPMLRKKNISVRTDLDEDVRLMCDKGWLCEAVENIIKNSADHSECTEISAEVTADPIKVTIALSDNGKGIPQNEIPKLFECFSSGSSDRSMYSSGLGMSISQKIVRGHGGEIFVYSEEGSGARFEFVFLKN
ncbi:sensor histidine kinase KdpD [Ruminococcus flavefaciens]|uniref:sensor histidine kinase n=1 Tax=Ruminococcus flavefaciens TaxID=1265 RepID=UPI0013DBA0F9|nr:HAMP domain-containing sensor histidine kinase [Ruminococcus flavefaciens]